MSFQSIRILVFKHPLRQTLKKEHYLRGELKRKNIEPGCRYELIINWFYGLKLRLALEFQLIWENEWKICKLVKAWTNSFLSVSFRILTVWNLCSDFLAVNLRMLPRLYRLPDLWLLPGVGFVNLRSVFRCHIFNKKYKRRCQLNKIKSIQICTAIEKYQTSTFFLFYFYSPFKTRCKCLEQPISRPIKRQ